MTRPVLFFDGDCNLCDRTVQFVIRHEAIPEFEFVPLQSAAARAFLEPLGVAAWDLSSMLVFHDGRLYRESAAAIEVAKRLRVPWSWWRFAAAIPRPMRDAAYRYVGKHRLRWWGRSNDIAPRLMRTERKP